MSNLLDSIKGYITPELLGTAAQQLGESESGISKAIGGLAPTILSGILNKSDDANAMGSIFSMISNPQNAGFLSNIGGLLGGGNLSQGDPKDIAGSLMGTLFGNKVGAILNAVSSFSGIKSSSTSSLLGMVGPLVMGVLGKKIASDGLNVSGFLNLLKGEKSSIMGALPGGLSSVMGLADMGGMASKVTTQIQEEKSGGTNWLLPLLLLLGIGGGLLWYMKGCNKPAAAPVVKVEEPKPAPAPAPEAATPALTMPAGTEEANMLAFIMGKEELTETKWFNFPEIMFDVAKSTLKPESEAKLNNILAILKAYPTVKVTVGGYTDSDGNDAANLKLSDDRAKAAAAWLTSKGIAADRLNPKGYGEAHPVAPNDTPENKAKNRRISFHVTAR